MDTSTPRKKVAIVGFSETTRDLAPYEDPAYEIWACNHLYRFIPRGDRWFEIHTLEELKIKYGNTNNANDDVSDWEAYYRWMRELPEGQILYMMEAHETIPQSRTLPIEELKARYYFLEEETATAPRAVSRVHRPRAVFKSTISYMIAMALSEGFTTIALYGIDMVLDFEYGFQRHNTHYFLGWARGMGVDVIIPEKCALMKEADGMDLYAYENTVDRYGDLIRMLQKRIVTYDRELTGLAHDNTTRVENMQMARGAVAVLDQLMRDYPSNGEACCAEFSGITSKTLQELRDANRKAHTLEGRENLELLETMKQVQGHRDEADAIAQKVGYNNRGEQL